MSRLPTTRAEQLNDKQRELFDRILQTRSLRTDGDMMDITASIEPGGSQVRLQLVG